jgi:hypothetical protein
MSWGHLNRSITRRDQVYGKNRSVEEGAPHRATEHGLNQEVVPPSLGLQGSDM